MNWRKSLNSFADVMETRMSKKAFDNIMAGLQDAKAFAEGDTSRAKVRVVNVVDVKRIRAKTKLSQARFAAVYHIPLPTLQGWEQGRRQPDAPAAALLHVIDKDPQGTAQALADV